MEKEGLGAEIEIETKDETGFSEQEIDIKMERGVFVNPTDPAQQIKVQKKTKPKTIFEENKK